MKLLVFSDSHGASRPIEAAIKCHPDAQTFIFLGDGLREAENVFSSHPDIPNITVRGNCDWYGEGTPAQSIVDFDGTRVLCTHGHRFGVKSTIMTAAQYALENTVSLVLFGHTHIPTETVVNGVRLFNPGSVGQNGSYGIVYIEKGKIVCSHGQA